MELMRRSIVPVVRAADEAKAGKGLIRLSETDPCVVLGEGTNFLSQFSPQTQIMLSKSLNFAVAEVIEIISDTELRIKKEFGGENGKGTARFREAVKESDGKGIAYKALPFVDQQMMYGHVYQRLKEGGCIGIFPEGTPGLPLFHC
jgi:glycerol-3-phosphate O-acyltransferase/dihydroxyacetone phosphate acyltransferase